MLLSAQGLRFSYGAREVLRGVGADVRPGEILALLGPNGAGKSTLLRLLAGLLTPGSGSVVIGGQAILKLTARERAQRVAVVPQDLPMDAGFTALQVVLMGRAPHQGAWALDSPRDRELARAALAEVGLADLENRVLAELSGGERRRVLVARALAQEPKVLLLDEPTAFLDLAHQAQVLSICRARARAGLAVGVVLHDPNLARASADRVSLLGIDGRADSGSAVDLLTPERLSALYGLNLKLGPALIPAEM